MLKTQIKTMVICDCCGKEYISNTCDHRILYMKYTISFGKTYEIREVCDDCNVKIIDFLEANSMLDYAQIIN